MRVGSIAAVEGGATNVCRPYWVGLLMTRFNLFNYVEYVGLNPYRQQLLGDEKESWKWWFEHRDPFA